MIARFQPAVEVASALLWLLLTVRIQLVGARIYQIEEYEASRTWRWASQRAWNWHRSVRAGLLIAFLGYASYVQDASRLGVPELVWAASFLVAIAIWRWVAEKKALVWTARMRRLGITTLLLDLIATAGIAAGMLRLVVPLAGCLVLLLLLFATTLPLVILFIADLLLRPVEARVRRGYLRSAAARLAAARPRVVAVTGSWGKTSTKHALAQLLPPEARVLATRKSFNTLMGVTRVLNEDLTANHRTLIVEMDAYARGEIAGIAALVHPEIAIVTAVGAQHLERFSHPDEIADALYEAVEALPESGCAVIQCSDAATAALATRAAAAGLRVVRYGIAGENPAVALDAAASDVTMSAEGVSFTLAIPQFSFREALRVPLLGRHQALNITAALVTVALLGYDIGAAAERVARLQPVEHRLQLVPGASGVTVIDDSYNANPVGVHNGLEVLAELAPRNGSAHRRRILVTPGLVELGPDEKRENRRYGEHAAEICDHVIVMRAATTDALVDGLQLGGMAADRLHVVDTLDEATAVIATLTSPGDVVLFANDLPDSYLR